MLRWVNLTVAVALVALLVTELIRSREPAPAAGLTIDGPTVVVEERPARRSRRMERRLAIEEARRRQHERPTVSTGRTEFDFTGQPIRD